MTVLCNGGPSGPNASFANNPILILAADRLVNFVQTAGMPWLIDWVPGAGQLSFDLNTFCATDPPDLPNIDAARIASWAISPTGAAELRADMSAIVGHFLWWTTCACSSVQTPPPPAPLPQPTGYQLNPPTVVPPTATSNCGSAPVPFGQQGWTNGVPTINMRLPASETSDGLTHITMALALTTATPIIFPITFTASFYTANLVQLAGSFSFVQSGPSPTPSFNVVDFDVPPGTRVVDWAMASANGGNNNFTTSGTYYLGCGGPPNTPTQPCCPPDATTQQLLFQIYATVQQILTEGTGGFTSWTDSTRHSGLTGNGQVVLTTGTIGVRTEFTAIPPLVRLSPGSPDFYWDLGFLTPLAIDVPLRGWRTVFKEQSFQLPPFADSIAWTLPDGAAMDLVELKGV